MFPEPSTGISRPATVRRRDGAAGRREGDGGLPAGANERRERQARVHLPAVLDEQRHAAQGAVRVGGHVEEPRGAGGASELRQVADDLRRADKTRSGPAAPAGSSVSGCRTHASGGLPASGAEVEGVAEDEGALSEDLGQALVVVGDPAGRIPEADDHPEVALDLARDQRQGGAVGFGKDDVQRDGRRAEVAHPLEQLRHPIARPGPLAVTGEALFVDVDDHRHGARRAVRRTAQEDVVDPSVDVLEGAGGGPGRRRRPAG